MSDADLSKLPTGQLSWAALVEYAIASDDRIERYFLEVKSDVDLATARGRSKVAKFILGSANRDPVRAATRFGGHAVMLLGVGSGEAPGIEPFEAKDLAREVTRLIGTDGPRWDFERIPVGAGRDVIAVHVDPPPGELYTCRADGVGLADGDIYVRGDGETRKATGDEVRLMVDRAKAQAPAVDIAVEVDGQVGGLIVDTEFLTEVVQAEADRLCGLAVPRTSAYSLAVTMASQDRRRQDEYLAQVEQWRISALDDPEAGVRELAAHVRPGIRIRVNNKTSRFLRGARIEVKFDEPVVALEWEDPESTRGLTPFPGVPQDWGTDTLSSAISLGVLSGRRPAPAFSPTKTHGVARIITTSPASLSMPMDDLRPEEDFLSDDDDVVLAIVGGAIDVRSVSGHWRMTAEDIHEVFSGVFTVPVEVRDWRQPMREWVLGTEDDEGQPTSERDPTA